MTLSRTLQDPLAKLQLALADLHEATANRARVETWLDAELDEGGVPRTLPIPRWAEALALLSKAKSADPSWILGHEDRVTSFVKACLRFARPDGSMCFRATPLKSDMLGRCALHLSNDPGVARVVAWWFPKLAEDDDDLGAPFLPAGGGNELPLACLRSDWTKRGEWLAVDARSKGSVTQVELGLNGQPWLGSDWRTGEDLRAGVAQPQPIYWSTRSMADVFEWSVKVGPTKVTRTVVLLRGQKLALLAEQQDGLASPGCWSIGLEAGLEPRAFAEHGGLRLDASGSRGSALAIPLGAASQPGKTLSSSDGKLILQATDQGQRRWLPLLMSWDGLRHKKAMTWRRLTVAEKSKAVPSDVAFAARISFGRDETLVVYRSLGPPALRSFLGHQTNARFVLGWFNAEGNIQPIVTINA